MSRRIKVIIAVPAALVAVAALFAVVGLIARDGTSGSIDSQTTVQQPERTLEAGGAAEPVMGSDTGTSGKNTSGGAADETADEQSISGAVPPASAASAHHLLRTGDLSLLVVRGTLLSAVDRVKSMTTAMNGYVMSSALGSQPSDIAMAVDPVSMEVLDSPPDGERVASTALENPYASLVVRVPERLFETAIKRFSKLGEVQGASTSSEDVTAQYVDLQARLRHFRAVERRLLGFLSETSNVSQMLAVQDRIDKVQLTIEELSAQLKSLRETTTYGTLSVYLSVKDGTTATVHASDTFGGTFWKSVKLLGHGARVTGLVLTALLPFIVVFGGIGLVAWYALRRMRRGRRHAAPPTIPA